MYGEILEIDWRVFGEQKSNTFINNSLGRAYSSTKTLVVVGAEPGFIPEIAVVACWET
jgi:hypothetical protein